MVCNVIIRSDQWSFWLLNGVYRQHWIHIRTLKLMRPFNLPLSKRLPCLVHNDGKMWTVLEIWTGMPRLLSFSCDRKQSSMLEQILMSWGWNWFIVLSDLFNVECVPAHWNWRVLVCFLISVIEVPRFSSVHPWSVVIIRDIVFWWLEDGYS